SRLLQGSGGGSITRVLLPHGIRSEHTPPPSRSRRAPNPSRGHPPVGDHAGTLSDLSSDRESSDSTREVFEDARVVRRELSGAALAESCGRCPRASPSRLEC